MLSALHNSDIDEIAHEQGVEVQFLLLQNFSMVSFTGAVDALVTSNLIRPKQFRYSTISVKNQVVKSDLGIDVYTDSLIPESNANVAVDDRLRVLVVCGGYRCALDEDPRVSSYLRALDKKSVWLCSLWNGAIHLAHAGLLEQQKCAAHPDNHAFISEFFPQVELSENSFVVADKRASCSGPTSAIEMMINVVGLLKDETTVRAIREIICCDKLPENPDSNPLRFSDDVSMPASVRDIVLLMKNNIEEPLSLLEISALVQLSVRQVERLFRNHLETTPSRYYLKIRINYATQLIQQSDKDVLEIAVASGFVTTSHFSTCFKKYTGLSPTEARKKIR